MRFTYLAINIYHFGARSVHVNGGDRWRARHKWMIPSEMLIVTGTTCCVNAPIGIENAYIDVAGARRLCVTLKLNRLHGILVGLRDLYSHSALNCSCFRQSFSGGISICTVPQHLLFFLLLPFTH